LGATWANNDFVVLLLKKTQKPHTAPKIQLEAAAQSVPANTAKPAPIIAASSLALLAIPARANNSRGSSGSNQSSSSSGSTGSPTGHEITLSDSAAMEDLQDKAAEYVNGLLEVNCLQTNISGSDASNDDELTSSPNASPTISPRNSDANFGDLESTSPSAPRLSSAFKQGGSVSVEELSFEASRPYVGVPLKVNKTSIFKTYPNSFTGAALVQWISKFLGAEVNEATNLASEMLAQDRIAAANHRKNAAKTKKIVNGDKHFYRFATRKRVVIVGAGFAGIYLYQLIRKGFDVTLVDEKMAFEYNLDFHLLVGDPSQINSITMPFKNFIKSATFVQKKVLAVAPDAVYLDNETHKVSQAHKLTFDHVCWVYLGSCL